MPGFQGNTQPLNPIQSTVDGSLLAAGNTEPEDKPQVDVLAQDDFTDYTVASSKLQRLEQDWQSESKETLRRRKVRNIEINIREFRRTGKLPKDETIVTNRIIDTNIQREMPPYIAYIKQSRRLSIFKDTKNPNANTEALEAEFTRVCQYDGWELPHFKVLDGRATHGWDWVEICFDPDKPGNVALEHVGHDQLMFPIDSRTLQPCEYISRVFHVTESQAKAFVELYGFDPQQVSLLLSKQTDSEPPRLLKIRKCMYKEQKTGIVYVAWYSLEQCNDWLKKPVMLSLGRKEQVQSLKSNPDPMTAMLMPMVPVMEMKNIPEKSYPYESLFYYETEEPRIFDHKGRVFLDEATQEASMAIFSAYVNGMTRAAQVFASVDNVVNGTDGKPRMINTELVPSGIYDNPLKFFNMPYPSPDCVNAINLLGTKNAAETNQVDFAVNNRKDSRKTATEIDAAQQQSALLNGVAVTLYSVFLRRVYTRVWQIVQNRAQQGVISFLDSNPQKDQILAGTYQLFAAGDVDVIQRQEKLNRKMQFWPVVQATPAAAPFLASMLMDAFPDEAPKWIEYMMAAQQQTQVLGAAAQALTGMAQAYGDQMAPAAQQNVLKILDAVEQTMTVSSGAMQPQGQEAAQPAGGPA